MSLKAKIEAVIYASEEPVTLAQLAGLLGLEAQGELDAIAARQSELPVGGESPAETHTRPDEAGPSMGHEQVDSPELPGIAANEAAEKRLARDRERKLREYLREIVEELIREFQTNDRGLEVREVAGGYRMATKPEYHDAVRGFVKSLKPPLKLTLQALETLAVVAYKQPVTAPEISEIRGVDSGGVLGSLMARKLITTAGRKHVIGRPILYKTTRDFLLRFGLKDISELPSIEEFEKMAGELADVEPLQEEIPMAEAEVESVTEANLEEEREASGPESAIDTVPADGRLSGPPPVYDGE